MSEIKNYYYYYGILNLVNRKNLLYKKLMKINRDSVLFDTKKQEFYAYKNTLRRLINQAKNNYYIILNNLTEPDVMAKRNGEQLTRHSIGKHQNPLPML